MASIADIERELEALVARGSASPSARSGRVAVTSPTLNALGSTRPRDEVGSTLNTDTILVMETSVGAHPALVFALAHGNYKDRNSTLASAVAVCRIHAELAQPLLGPADVPPALRRALLEANARVAQLVELEPGIRGIGASVVVAVATHREIVIAHVGENSAMLVRDGRARDLVVPHTLWFREGPEGRARMEPWQAELSQDIVLQVVGFTDPLRPDVVRCAVVPGDRIVLGNGRFRTFRDTPTVDWTSPREALVGAFERMSAAQATWVPPTVIVADISG